MLRSTQQGAGWRCGQSGACLRASPSQSNQHCLTSKEVLTTGLADQGLQWLQRGFPGQAVIPSASLVLPDPQTTEDQLGFVLLTPEWKVSCW
jgi:hypothetical protein